MEISVSEFYVSIRMNILSLNVIFVLFIIKIDLCLRRNDLRLKNAPSIIIKKNISIIVIIKEISYKVARIKSNI